MNLRCHKSMCSLRVVRMKEHLEVPFFSRLSFFRGFALKQHSGESLQGQSCASSHVHRITSVIPLAIRS